MSVCSHRQEGAAAVLLPSGEGCCACHKWEDAVRVLHALCHGRSLGMLSRQRGLSRMHSCPPAAPLLSGIMWMQSEGFS